MKLKGWSMAKGIKGSRSLRYYCGEECGTEMIWTIGEESGYCLH